MHPEMTLRGWERMLRTLGHRHLARRIRKRECGSCSACCTTNSVDGVTEAGERCPMLAPGGGCSIYNRRPGQCSGYYCGWRLGFGATNQRPDKVGGHWEWHASDDAPEIMLAYFRMDRIGFDVEATLETAGELVGIARVYWGVITAECKEGDPVVCVDRLDAFRTVVEIAARGGDQAEIRKTIHAPTPQTIAGRGPVTIAWGGK